MVFAAIYKCTVHTNYLYRRVREFEEAASLHLIRSFHNCYGEEVM